MLSLLNLIWNFGSSVRTGTCFTDLDVCAVYAEIK